LSQSGGGGNSGFNPGNYQPLTPGGGYGGGFNPGGGGGGSGFNPGGFSSGTVSEFNADNVEALGEEAEDVVNDELVL